MAFLTFSMRYVFKKLNQLNSSAREQSNKTSGTRLKTESETGRFFFRLTRFARVRLLRHSLPISLLILRKKKQRFCSLGFTPYKYIIQKQKIPLEKHARMCLCLCVCGGGRG